MTTQDQIKALAELDGWKQNIDEAQLSWKETWSSPANNFKTYFRFTELPRYLTSYDAIIPLIQKQDNETRCSISEWCHNNHHSPVIMATPAQLCEALLRATGKWKVERMNLLIQAIVEVDPSICHKNEIEKWMVDVLGDIEHEFPAERLLALSVEHTTLTTLCPATSTSPQG